MRCYFRSIRRGRICNRVDIALGLNSEIETYLQSPNGEFQKKLGKVSIFEQTQLEKCNFLKVLDERAHELQRNFCNKEFGKIFEKN